MPRSLLCPTLSAMALASAASAAFAGPQAASPPPTAETRQKLATELDAYLWKHVLAPRFPRCVDKEHGGFHVNYARDWSPQEDRSRFIVYEARVVWTAATVARLRPDRSSEYLPYVRHGVRYLADVMWDREHGGFHTLVDLSGRAVAGEFPGRPVYGQAFAIYGLAAAHAATGDAEPLELARRAYRWVEDHYRDDLGPGYRSAVKPDGQPFPAPKAEAAGARESIEGPALHRTMNDHIHLLEAYAELLAVLAGPGAAEAHRGAARLRPRPAVRGAGLPLHRPAAGRARRPRAGLVRPRRGDGLPDDRGGGGPRPRAVGGDPARGAHARGPGARARLRPRPRTALRGRQRLRPGHRPVGRVVGPVRGLQCLPADGRAVRPGGRPVPETPSRRRGPWPGTPSPTRSTRACAPGWTSGARSTASRRATSGS